MIAVCDHIPAEEYEDDFTAALYIACLFPHDIPPKYIYTT